MTRVMGTTLAVAALLCGASSSARASWEYSDLFTADNKIGTVHNGNTEAVVFFYGLGDLDGPAQGVIVVTDKKPCWMAVQVKCEGSDASDWSYAERNPSNRAGDSTSIECPDGANLEWVQGALWVDDGR
jgi:hypothetical protein